MEENKSRVVILVGRSGSGKGTQGQFIKKFLEENFPENEMHYLSTGDEMRRIMKQASYTAQLSREAMENGNLQPMFFSAYVWAKYLMDHVHGNDNIIFDGVPRRKEEAKILHSAIKFYSWHKPVVINIDVPEEECIRRMVDRKRADDNIDSFKKKMEWYKMEVEPMIEWYKESNLYTYCHVDGNKKVDEISEHISNFLKSHYNLMS